MAYETENWKMYVSHERLVVWRDISGCHNLWEHGSIAPGRGKFSQEIFLDKKKD